MLSQRAGDDENPAESQFRKWTAKGTMKGRRWFFERDRRKSFRES